MSHQTNNMTDDGIHIASLTDLPNNVFAVIFPYCSLSSLCALSVTCRTLNDLVKSIGYRLRQRMREQRGISWVPACLNDVLSWTPLARLRYDALGARNLRSRSYTKRTLTADPWHGNRKPLIALGPARIRMVVGAERKLYVYRFESYNVGDGAPAVRLEGTYTIASPMAKIMDLFNPYSESLKEIDIMECLAFLPDGGADRTLLVGFTDGYFMQVKLPEHSASADINAEVDISSAYQHDISVGNCSISVYDDFVFSLSGREGRGMLSKFSSESGFNFSSPQTFKPAKGGSCALLLPSFSSNGPCLAVGAQKGWAAPLSLHALVEDTSTVSAEPTLILGMPDGGSGSGVISLAPAPPAFPGAHSRTMLVSSWADGCVRLYDVRVSAAGHYNHPEYGNMSLPVLPPVLTLSEPKDGDYGFFPVATGGPVGTTVATSHIRAIVKLWDVRSPDAPVVTEDVNWVNDASRARDPEAHADRMSWIRKPAPMSNLALAGARCFGATFHGPFELDFSGGRARNGATHLPVSA